MSAAAPLVVAVDLDEVLGSFVETLARFHNEVYGGCLTAGREGGREGGEGGGREGTRAGRRYASDDS